MKKIICIVLIILLSLSLTGCQKDQEPQLRLVQQITQGYLNGELAYTSQIDHTYGENGYRISSTVTTDGQVTETRTYTRDEYGNTLSMTRTTADGTQTEETHVLTLDEQHRILRDECSTDGVLTSISGYGFDADGNMTVLDITRITPTQGEVISRTRMVYDESGNLTRQSVTWEPMTDNSSYILCSYQDGRLLRETNYDLSAQVLSFRDYSYDETGLIQTMISSAPDGTVSQKVVTTYDSYGNILKQEAYLASYEDPTVLELASVFTYIYEEVPIGG